jgi:Anti-sigma factor NepR
LSAQVRAQNTATLVLRRETVKGNGSMNAPSRKGTARLFAEESLPDKLSAEPALDRATQERIGTHLRAMYDDLMQQPVPDRFVDLLNRLEGRKGNTDQ